jgi:hypothetical protein
VVKIGRNWALTEWYPERRRREKAANDTPLEKELEVWDLPLPRDKEGITVQKKSPPLATTGWTCVD